MKSLAMTWGTMAFDDAGGPGPALLMLHGTGCDSRDWDGVIGELPRTLRVIPMDFRGHGGSTAPTAPFSLEDLASDVLVLADRLGLASFNIVGHSLGGIAAMAAAARSKAVAGLILLEGWTNVAAYGAFAGMHHYGNLDAAAVRQIKTKANRVVGKFPPATWDHFSRTVRSYEGYPFLQGAKIPVQEVYGDAGRLPDTERRLCIPSNPNITTAWIPGAGHYLPHEAPREVARICRAAISAK